MRRYGSTYFGARTRKKHSSSLSCSTPLGRREQSLSSLAVSDFSRGPRRSLYGEFVPFTPVLPNSLSKRALGEEDRLLSDK